MLRQWKRNATSSKNIFKKVLSTSFSLIAVYIYNEFFYLYNLYAWYIVSITFIAVFKHDSFTIIIDVLNL